MPYFGERRTSGTVEPDMNVWRFLPAAAAAAAVAVGLALIGGEAVSADKYAVKVPDGLAFYG